MDTISNTLNLPSLKEIEELQRNLKSGSELTEAEKELSNLDKANQVLDKSSQQSLEFLESREQRINQLVDLAEYDKDQDNIFTEAMAAFKDVLTAAGDSPAMAAGKMFDASARFLEIAQNSKVNKLKGRLDVIDLALKKQKIEQASQQQKEDPNSVDAKGYVFDRNELLAEIKNSLENTKNSK